MEEKSKISPAALFEEQCAQLAARGFAAKDCTVGLRAANIYGILTALPFVGAGIAAFVLAPSSMRNMLSFSADFLLLAVLLILSVPVHECLHALAWAAARGSAAGIRFGFNARFLTPYCACAYPMRRAQYFAGILAPFAVLGAGFCIAASLTGYWALCVLGAFNILSAGADLLVSFRLAFARGKYFLDHAERCGFYAFSEKKRPPRS